jgi:hypothetical protein
MLALLAWTFGVGLAFLALLAWIAIWLLVAARVLRRRDLGTGGKALWIVVILFVPLVGLFVYFIWDAARPRAA